MPRHLPLYAGAADGAELRPTAKGPRVWSGNAGLWYDKFCDRWRPDLAGFPDPPKSGERDGGSAKLDWVESLVYPRTADGTPDRAKPPVLTGDPGLLAEMAERSAALARARGGRVLDFTLASRLLTGLGRRHPTENGVAWHHSLGVPYLAGSAVKGLLRSAAERDLGDDPAARTLLDALFGPRLRSGTDDGTRNGDERIGNERGLYRGALIMLDALPVGPVRMVAEVMTPHTGPWNLADPDAILDPEKFPLDDVPADWHSPNPIVLAGLEADAVFRFVLLPATTRAPDPDAGDAKAGDWPALLDRVTVWLDRALAELGAGAKTASGYGRFRRDGGAAGLLWTPHDPDVTLPPRPPGSRRAAAAPPCSPQPGSSQPGPTRPTAPAPPKRGHVDGEPVEVLRREGDFYVVKFLDSGDIERVRVEELE